MRQGAAYSVAKLVEYDALRRRLWIFGQRCHHGATGSVVAARRSSLCSPIQAPVAKPHVGPRSVLALTAAGGALMMAHDWKDRAIWFERGRGSQLVATRRVVRPRREPRRSNNLRAAMPVRCAIVPPTPVPYREPLFRALHERDDLDIRVIYQSAGQPSWDVPSDWFPREHPYPAVHLRSRQRRRAGRTPMLWPRGLERALRTADPDCVVVSEYGPASLRVFNWCRRHKRAYVIFTECTPGIDPLLPRWQLGLHRWLGARADGLIATSSAARARLLAFGVPDERITVALQAADLEPFRAASRDDGRDGVKVISAGRLVPDKNFATLIEAFSRIADEATLEIVGTGFLEGELKQLAARLGVPVRLRGPRPALPDAKPVRRGRRLRADQHLRAVRRGGPRGGRRRACRSSAPRPPAPPATSRSTDGTRCWSTRTASTTSPARSSGWRQTPISAGAWPPRATRSTARPTASRSRRSRARSWSRPAGEAARARPRSTRRAAPAAPLPEGA